MSKSPKLRVAVTGVGLVNPFGGDTEDFFARIMQGESAVSLYHHSSSSSPIAQPAVVCKLFNPDQAIGRSLSTLTDRYSQLGISAAFSAWDDAGLPRTGAGSDDYGVSWGTAVGGAQTIEKGYVDFYEHGKRRASPLSVVQVMSNAAASHIAILLGLGGSCLTYSVACASSAISIGEAFRRIQMGDSTLIVAGGSEAPLTLSIMRAWEGMRVIAMGDEETAYRVCRPFQEGRTGFVLGEGGAALVLEEWDHAVARGARIYCELAGYGQSCDHLNLVRPDINGQVRAINAALREAELTPAEVGYVNAHGTATTEGDPIEINTLKIVFGDHAANLPVSATKSMHGHLLGAAGAVEALITVLALARQEIPPTAHLDEVAADCLGVRHVMGEGLRGMSFKAAVTNSFAFGGSNAVLAFRSTL
jgi:3-oxoacyl-[acyl-carrier-protein] synthase II